MRTTKFSTKRVLGLVLATALAATGVVAVAGSSEAAVTALTLSPKTGPAVSTTQVIAVTGKGFMTGTTSQVGTIEFDTSACGSASGASGSVAVSVSSVVSATKLTLTTPSLALTGTSTPWYLCVFSNAGTPVLLGSAKYTVYAAPTYTSKSTASGSNLGGTSVDFVGSNFTKAVTVKVDGVAATKVTFGSATGITAVFPAHAASATAVNVVITTEGGDVSGGTFTYVRGSKVTPATGTVGTLHTIDVIGAGFNATSAATVSLTNGPLIAANVKFSCGNIQIVSPTELTCDVPTTVTAGAYSVIVADVATVAATTATVISSTSTYTAAAF